MDYVRSRSQKTLISTAIASAFGVLAMLLAARMSSADPISGIPCGTFGYGMDEATGNQGFGWAASCTPTASPTGTATGCTVTPNSPYQAGLNAVVVQGTCTSAEMASATQAQSGRSVLAVWAFRGGLWQFYIPANPGIAGGLSGFGDLVAAYLILP